MDIPAFNPPTPLFFFLEGGGFILYFLWFISCFSPPLGHFCEREAGELWAPKGVFLVSPTEGIPHFSIVFFGFFFKFLNDFFSPCRGRGSEPSAGREALPERARESSG